MQQSSSKLGLKESRKELQVRSDQGRAIAVGTYTEARLPEV